MIHLTRITGIMPLCVSCTAERAFYALGKARKAPATSCPIGISPHPGRSVTIMPTC